MHLQPLPELEMLSPWFDCSASWLDSSQANLPLSPSLRGLLVLAPPRAGSFHLARLLWHLGYGMPTEYFNRNTLYRSLLSRWGSRPRWQRLLLRWRGDRVWPQRRWFRRLVLERRACSRLSGSEFFSSKLQPFQLPGTFASIWPRLQRELANAGCLTPDQRSLLLLLRREWTASVASYHLSRCSGAYDLGITPTFQHRPLAHLLHPEALLESADHYHRHLRWLHDATRVVQPLIVHHEDLVRDQVSSLWRLLQHCDPALAEQRLSPAWRDLLSVPVLQDQSAWAGKRRSWLIRIGQLLADLNHQGRIPLARDQPLLDWLAAPPTDRAGAA